MKLKKFPIACSSTKLWFPIETSIEEFKPVVAEKKEFEFRDKPKSETLDNKDCDGRHKTTNFWWSTLVQL